MPFPKNPHCWMSWILKKLNNFLKQKTWNFLMEINWYSNYRITISPMILEFIYRNLFSFSPKIPNSCIRWKKDWGYHTVWSDWLWLRMMSGRTHTGDGVKKHFCISHWDRYFNFLLPLTRWSDLKYIFFWYSNDKKEWNEIKVFVWKNLNIFYIKTFCGFFNRIE